MLNPAWWCGIRVLRDDLALATRRRRSVLAGTLRRTQRLGCRRPWCSPSASLTSAAFNHTADARLSFLVPRWERIARSDIGLSSRGAADVWMRCGARS
jgi:hypothetical protein